MVEGAKQHLNLLGHCCCKGSGELTIYISERLYCVCSQQQHIKYAQANLYTFIELGLL